jgi:hypothetical protein
VKLGKRLARAGRSSGQIAGFHGALVRVRKPPLRTGRGFATIGRDPPRIPPTRWSREPSHVPRLRPHCVPRLDA